MDETWTKAKGNYAKHYKHSFNSLEWWKRTHFASQCDLIIALQFARRAWLFRRMMYTVPTIWWWRRWSFFFCHLVQADEEDPWQLNRKSDSSMTTTTWYLDVQVLCMDEMICFTNYIILLLNPELNWAGYVFSLSFFLIVGWLAARRAKTHSVWRNAKKKELQ